MKDDLEPYEPETVPVPAPLLEKYEGFFPPAVIQVTDGVYVARGYNRDNPVLIEGNNGLIVVDPGESIPAAQTVKDAFNAQLDNIFDKKPVKAIIYTHGHDCHINGASVFADEHTEIIAQEGLMNGLFNEWFGQVFPSRAEGGVKMAGAYVYGRSRSERKRLVCWLWHWRAADLRAIRLYAADQDSKGRIEDNHRRR